MVVYIFVKVVDFRYTFLKKLYFSPQIVVKFDVEECIFNDWEHGFCCVCFFLSNEDYSFLKKKMVMVLVQDGQRPLCRAYVDVGFVLDSEGHQLCRKWLPLTLEDDTGSIVGYAQVCLTISEHELQHECHKVNPALQEQTIEQNLIVPKMLLCGRKLAVYCLHVYRAEGIPSSYNRQNLSVRAYMAGIKAETSMSCVKNDSVSWNEVLVYTDVFPLLHSLVRVELIRQNVAISVMHIDLCNLPEGVSMFGPNMMHMYTTELYEAGQLYMGRLLITFKVIEHVQGIESHLIPPLLEDEDLSKVDLMLVGEIRDGILCDGQPSGQPMRLELSLGEISCSVPDGFVSGNETLRPFSLYPVRGTHVHTSHAYLSCSQDACTVHLRMKWTDNLYRLYRTNHLGFITNNLKCFVESLSDKLKQKKPGAAIMVQTGLRKLCDDCESYLASHGHLQSIGNQLDIWRLKLCLDELTRIKEEAYNLAVNRTPSPQETRIWARKILQALELLANDPQDSLPDVVLSLWVGESQFAYRRIPARQVLYSDLVHARGNMCGTVSSLILEHVDSTKMAAVMDAKLWLGSRTAWDQSQKWEHYAVCPVACENFSLFATICQGYALNPKKLQNTYVTVSVKQHSKRTQVRPGVQHPRWNELLWFPNIRFDGQPPSVVLELWTQNLCVSTLGGDNCFGCSILKPTIGLIIDSLQITSSEPKFSWHNLMNGDQIVGQLFAVFHLQQETEDNVYLLTAENQKILPGYIPDAEQHYRLEVLLWGLRDIKIPQWKMISNRTVTIRFAGHVITHTFDHPELVQNFDTHDLRTVDLVLPRENFPPLRIAVKDTHKVFMSVFRHHTVENMQEYIIQLVRREDFASALHGPLLFSVTQQSESKLPTPADAGEETSADVEEKSQTVQARFTQFFSNETPILPALKRLFSKVLQGVDGIREQPRQLLPLAWRQDDVYDIVYRETRYDWWTKYFGTLAAIQEVTGDLVPGTEDELIVPLKKEMMKIYFEELENQAEFGEFSDSVKTFPLIREGHVSGKFKAAMRMYQLPVEGMVMPDGSLPGSHHPTNEPVDLLVRVYVVRAIGLTARDITGSSDPYIVIGTSTRDSLVNDRENYIPVTVDPIFGSMFELELSLPNDYLLNITVMDRDEVKWDDLIGTTSIDIENRYYSRHRATRGISRIYKEDGYMSWRDNEKPTDILAALCKRYNIEGPVYQSDHVILGGWDEQLDAEPDPIKKEKLALAVLNQWETVPYVGCKLVPEHVETRTLYDPNLVGKSQGLLQLWVDIFESKEVVPHAVNIVPRHPEPYELRVTIWNTSDVILHDYSILSGRYSSDIYILGWVCKEKVAQETDIHYRSLTGEGNFNYRLIFNFDFWSAEGKISLPKKNETTTKKPRTKFPCVLVMEVWDNNHIFRDDRLGLLKLNLLRLPQGANSSRWCTLETLGPKTRTTDLFVQKRTRGWWPFQADSETGPKLTGKIDMELELLSKEEAEARPAGRGRSAPNPLEKPVRPETSFDWLRHPLRAFYYSIWLENRRKVFKLLFYALVMYIAFRFLLALPDTISSIIARKIAGC